VKTVLAAMSAFCWQLPRLALMVKWLLYVAAGFLLAMAMHFARPAVIPLEQPLQVRGFHVVREILFALGFLLVVLLLSEPFLAQESQRVEFPLRLRLPTTGALVSAGSLGAHTTIMKQLSLLTLLLFFVLQGLLYTACLFKLAEIRRQKLTPRVKLKLLENEDHLFDAGLYLGFAGTIISLILVSLGVIQPSLMAAYSSTSFGIVFVSAFKIFNLRPVRRRLLLEAEAELSEPVASRGGRSFANPS
jgi:formate/nitrite transporter FocA (FNT family)